MSKAVKTLIICCYAVLLVQYLRISLKSVKTEIDIEYIFTTNKYMSKKQKLIMSKKYHNFTTYLKSFRRPERFGTDLKFVLKYTNAFMHYTSALYGNGQKPFIDNNCTYYNCYLTTQRNLLTDFRDYDAILFDVENTWDGPIVMREPYQKFVFMASESATRFPLCDPIYDSFYNLSWTYRLDSDIPSGYFKILDENGNHVGPKINMSWIDPMKPTAAKVKKELEGKTKAAAWFVSNCNAASGRQVIAKDIQEELKKYQLTVDIYGYCGKLKCPKDIFDECLYMLKSEYYFYLAFENSVCPDYVTEKVLYPLNNYAVPIVYGGADYSRFLPPGSYINALKLNATEIVSLMMKAIMDLNVYEQYFRWHNHYSYIKNPPHADVCQLCRILNEDAGKHHWYKSFRKWWIPDYPKLCGAGGGRLLVKKDDLKGVVAIKQNVQGDM